MVKSILYTYRFSKQKRRQGGQWVQDMDTIRLWNDYFSSRSIETRNALVEHYKSLSPPMVNSHFNNFTSEDRKDLCQEGIIGIIEHIGKFDPTRGVKPETYLNKCMVGKCKNYVRSKGRTIRLSGQIQELECRYKKVVYLFCLAYGREPKSNLELAQFANCSEDEIAAVKKALDRKLLSIDGDSDNDDSCHENPLSRILCQDIDSSLNNQYILMLKMAIPTLKPLHRFVILSALKGYPQSEIGKILGLSQTTVFRIYQTAITELRGKFCLDQSMPIHWVNHSNPPIKKPKKIAMSKISQKLNDKIKNKTK